MQKTVVDLTTGDVTVVEMTEEEIAGLPKITPPSREEWRLTAFLERGRFVRALKDHGVLPVDEVITAAKGDWPATFASALMELPVDPLDAQIDWAAAPGVSRLNPLFCALLDYYGRKNDLTAAQAEALGDAIFGWPPK